MPNKSLHPELDIPNVAVTTLLFETSRPKRCDFPADHKIFIDAREGWSLSIRDLQREARRFGAGLIDHWGWKKGDVLCIFSTNQLETPIVVFGTLYALGVVMPANPAYMVNELLHQLDDAGAKAIVTVLELLPVARAAAKGANIGEDRIVLFEQASGSFKKWDSLLGERLADPIGAKIDPHKDLAFIAYSSGTTGTAKGAMLSHYNIVAATCQQGYMNTRELYWKNDKMLAVLPFYHIYGLTCSLHVSCWTGITSVIMARYNIQQFLEVIQKEQITFANIVPPIVLDLAKHPLVDKYNLRSLRMMNSGAAPLPSELVEQIYNRIKIPVKQGYGLTETSPTTHTQLWQHWQTHSRSIGLLLPNLEAKFVDEEGNEVSDGQDGELWIRGPNVFLGYWKNEKATKMSLTEDGWFKTGDVGHIKSDGMSYITDRAKELIKYKGFQVPPASLEGLIAAHPKVKDVAVIGVYSAQIASEVPRAYIVSSEPDKESLEKDIIQLVHDKVAHHKRLRGGVRFVDEIPKSASGKILRRILKEVAKKEGGDPLDTQIQSKL